jgi:hypothetical protein
MPGWIIDRDSGELVAKEEYYANKWQKIAERASSLPMPYIRGDIPAYVSPVTGKIVEGRAARRDDLARAGCREVDPSEYKPVYRNYEFCQKYRKPYMEGDVPPPMSRDEKAAAAERKAKEKAANDKREAVLKAEAAKNTDPDLPKILRGNPKTAPIFNVKP